VTQGQNRGHGSPILQGHSNLQRIAEAVEQISEPTLGLRRNPVPSARSEKQVPECFKKLIGLACFANQTLPLRAPDLSLHATFLTIAKKGV
jgi:hypothetical protein